LFVIGVGHASCDDEDALADVRRADGCSWKYNRPRFVAFSFQVSQNVVEAQGDEARNVLSKNPSWLASLDNAEHVGPEPSIIRLTSALASVTGRLAGEASDHKVNCSEFITDHLLNVAEALHVGEALLEEGVAEVVDLHLPDDLHPRPQAGEVDPANAGEQREDTHRAEGGGDHDLAPIVDRGSAHAAARMHEGDKGEADKRPRAKQPEDH
jgi:hypothetical protein